MSGHNYIADPNNLFEDDIDDELFLRKSQNSRGGSFGDSPHEQQSHHQHVQKLQERKQNIENRTLESTQNSLRMLHESEEIGKNTARELCDQREKLENSNRNLDDINNSLTQSQRHINGIKSIFGGLKNYMFNRNNNLNNNGSPSTSNSIKEEEKQSTNYTEKQLPLTPSNSFNEPYQTQTQLTKSVAPSSFEEKLSNNLDAMSDNLNRLKFLATDMYDEIESQNDLLDDMAYKMDSADIKIKKQQKTMDKLLKK